jgi:hypothetical protein
MFSTSRMLMSQFSCRELQVSSSFITCQRECILECWNGDGEVETGLQSKD